MEADHNGERGGEVVRHVIAFFKRCLRRVLAAACGPMAAA